MSEHELWNELGNLYFMSGAYNQAVFAYNRSIQLDSNFGRPYSNLALTYVQQGKYQEAIELYRSSIELLADNKEKAISWSRLGNVYRHLKDYTKAVVAYQQADELDPQCITNDQPQITVDDSLHEITDMPQSITDASSPTSAEVDTQQPVVKEKQIDPDLLYRVDSDVHSIEEVRLITPKMVGDTDPFLPDIAILVEASTPESSTDMSLSSPVPVTNVFPPIEEQSTDSEHEPDYLDDSTASWALADLTRYQQDISESPETGSLSTWGEPEPSGDEDWDLYPALDPDSDVYQPDAEGGNLTKWMPIPEDEPSSELEKLELFKELKKEMLEPDVIHSSINTVAASASYLQSSAVDMSRCSSDFRQQDLAPIPEQSSMDQTEQNPTVYPLALPARSSDRSPSKFHRIELDVEDRPSADNPPQRMADFVVAEETGIPPEENRVDPIKAEPECQPLVRDSQEMAEIEAGIAKFKRAVQVNPHNAYAWDALGTLYKSAGLYKDAILAYQQATSINPPKALYFHNLGLVYACEGRDEDAVGAFQRVIEIDPDYSLAHATLGGYYRKLGMEELAQKHIGKAMKNIFDSENEYNRACLEAICGNTDHAIELLGVALKNRQTYVDWILRDPDLDFIRQDPRFKQLVSDYTR